MSSARLGFGGKLTASSVSQTTAAVPTMGGAGGHCGRGQICNRAKLRLRPPPIRGLLTGLACSPALLPISFSACFVTHFDDSGLPGTSIAAERRTSKGWGIRGLILNESHCASPRFKWKNAPARNANESYLKLIGRREDIVCPSFISWNEGMDIELVSCLLMDGLVTGEKRPVVSSTSGSTLSSSCSCFERFDKKEPIGMCAPFNRLPLAATLCESASIPGCRAGLI